ncbi:MAG TPA: GAF domain-containing protein, partial [Candidatus Tectomicrobia bacterium]|nr:GAF domain-containing protein [Candidatus Tectomicrobia bacterium]
MDDFGQSLIEGLDDGVVVTDARLAIVAWNGAMERLTGIPRSKAIGRPATEILAVLSTAGVTDLLTGALAGTPGATGEVPYEAGKRQGWLAARFAPWRDRSGAIAGVVGFHVEVTARRHHEAVVRALDEVGRSLASSLDLDEVLDIIATRTLEVMGAEAAVVGSWDGRAAALEVVRSVGRLSACYAPGGAIPIGGGPITHALRGERPWVTRDVLAGPEIRVTPERRAQIEREGFRTVAAAPLRSKGRAHGALVAYYWTERAIDDDDLATLRLLAEHAAVAIDNARAHADATRRAERLRALAEVQQVVAESLVLDDVLRRIAHAAARLLDVPVVHLWTAAPRERALRLQGVYEEPGTEDDALPRQLAYGQSLTGKVALERRMLFIEDVTAHPGSITQEWSRATGIRGLLAVPITSGDELLGVLALRTRTAAVASEENRALVQSLAAHAAVALQNARMYAEAVRRGGRLNDLIGVCRTIAASLDTADVIQRIADAAAALRPGALAAVHVREADDTFRARAMAGPDWRDVPL